MTKAVAVCVLLLGASGCVLSPNHGDNVGPKSSTVTFQIYATEPSADLSITCSHHHGNTMTIANFTGGTQPWTQDDQTVYGMRHSMVIPEECWESWGGDGFSFITYIRVKQGSNNVMVFDDEGAACVWEKVLDGEGPMTAGFECRREGPDILLKATW